jgi:hypothetical protein
MIERMPKRAETQPRRRRELANHELPPYCELGDTFRLIGRVGRSMKTSHSLLIEMVL